MALSDPEVGPGGRGLDLYNPPEPAATRTSVRLKRGLLGPIGCHARPIASSTIRAIIISPGRIPNWQIIPPGEGENLAGVVERKIGRFSTALTAYLTQQEDVWARVGERGDCNMACGGDGAVSSLSRIYHVEYIWTQTTLQSSQLLLRKYL